MTMRREEQKQGQRSRISIDPPAETPAYIPAIRNRGAAEVKLHSNFVHSIRCARPHELLH
jgi:hypothetical protein